MKRERVESCLWLFCVAIIILSMVFLLKVKKESDSYKVDAADNMQERICENVEKSISYNYLSDNNRRERYPVLAISSIILVLGILFCVYLLIDYPSIDVYSYDLNGKLKKIGRIIAYKNGETIYTYLPRKVERLTETGQFQLQLNSDFVENNYNLTIIIKVGNRNYRENIKDKINITYNKKYNSVLGA